MSQPLFLPETQRTKEHNQLTTIDHAVSQVTKKELATDQAIARSDRLQVVAGNAFKPGIRVRRAKPKHLKVSMRKVAVRAFSLHQSEEDAARAINEPGITGRTIISTALLDALNRLDHLERITGTKRAA